MTNVPKRKDSTGKEPEEHASEEAPAKAAQSLDSGKKPIWSRHINRVSGSIWVNEQNGKTRHTVAIYRSYLDRRNNEWKRVFYYDLEDLQDLRAISAEAEDQLRTLREMTRDTEED